MSASIDEVGLLAPVSADAPCGPDLDAEGDPEFMNFMAAIEGQLPAAFFVECNFQVTHGNITCKKQPPEPITI